MAQNTIQQGSGLSGLQFRTNNNAALLTLQTSFSGNNAPSNPETYQYWIDTSSTPPTIKQRFNSAWLSVGQVAADWGLAKNTTPTIAGLATFTGNVTLTGTGYLKLPAGNSTTERPSTAQLGMLRYNNTTNKFEGYQSISGTAQWNDITVGQSILDNAVTAAKIADGAVTEAKLSDDVKSGRVKGRKLIGRNYNVFTKDIVASNVDYAYRDVYGHGNAFTYNNGINTCGFLARNGNLYLWGDSADSTYATLGNYSVSDLEGPAQVYMRHPKWLWHAQMGESTHQNALIKRMPLTKTWPSDPLFIQPSGKFFSWDGTDSDGNLNHTQYTRNNPQIVDCVHSSQRTYYLTENGMAFVSGWKYATSGASPLGNGKSPASHTIYVPTYISFYDDSADPVRLTGTNTPQIVQIRESTSSEVGHTYYNSYTANVQQFFTVYALDHNGVVYTWGYNAYGQCGNNTSVDKHYAQKLPASLFDNETIKYITASGGQYASAFAITSTGRLWAWGRNNQGQLGLQDSNDRDSPVELTGQTGNNLNGKKILHVIGHGHANTYQWTSFLADDGKVYTCGYYDGYGQNLGIYSTSASGTITNPTEITDHPSGTNEKVVSMWSYGSQFSTTFLITKTQDADATVKAYSFGNNAHGQLGRGASKTNTASASQQYDSAANSWFCREIEFTDLGDTYLQHTPGSYPSDEDSSGSELTGTRTGGSWPEASSVSTANEYQWIGEPVAFFANPNINGDKYEVVCLDSKGQLWHTGGSNTHVMSMGVEWDSIDQALGTDTELDRFAPFLQQPERAVEMQFLNNGAANTGYAMLGVSGVVYTWGIDGQGSLGTLNNERHGPTPLPLTTG